MTSSILDSSAVLAYLHHEPGFETVADLLDGAAMSSVNVAEVATRLIDRGVSREQAEQAIGNLSLGTISFDEPLAYRAAGLRGGTRGAGLSLGDRACLATAQGLGVRAVTADRSWSRLRVGVEIQIIR